MNDQDQSRTSPGLTDRHDDGRLIAPSAERNEQPIIDALGPVLTRLSGLMLEIGSGTGQHAAAWAAAFPDLDWQPSDPFDKHLDSCRAWVAHAGLPNLRAPIWLDGAEPWLDLGPLAGVISVNVIHISPWVVTKGIVQGASAALQSGGALVFYGPFKEHGKQTGDGNAKFDESLRAQDPEWGVRDVKDVADLARKAGLLGPVLTAMPANNRLLSFRKA